MSEKMRYKRTNCFVCGEFKILKDDICLDCDGGDEFVNRFYKFIKNIDTKVLCESSEEKLITLAKSYEEQGWVRLFPISFKQAETMIWYFRTTLVREKK